MTDNDVLFEFLRMSIHSTAEVFAKFAALPDAIIRGDALEQFLYVKGNRDNRVLLVAHADTYWDEHYGSQEAFSQEVVLENGCFRNLNGGLGANDRAGCAMIWLLKQLGHSILITNGEEQRRLGSCWLMNHNPDIADEINLTHQFAVQLDRRKATDFKCYTVGTDPFRSYVRQNTNYSEPDRASSTDIVTLCRDIAGVNLSIGYHIEHDENEYLVLEEWQHTLDVCRAWLSDPALPKFPL
ncbi:MAG: hypothetical protein WCK47_14175 [bacterium]